MCRLFGNKFSKLKREEVVDAICSLQRNEEALEISVEEKSEQISALIARGRTEPHKETRLFYAKKIRMLEEARSDELQRALFLLYNIRLLNKLKAAIDDKAFIKASGAVPLNKLLSDQKGLAVFLNKALRTRIKTEEIMTSSDIVFNDIRSSYSTPPEIYGDGDIQKVFDIPTAPSQAFSHVNTDSQEQERECLYE